MAFDGTVDTGRKSDALAQRKPTAHQKNYESCGLEDDDADFPLGLVVEALCKTAIRTA
jgi:hypothetical protein